MSCAMTVWVFVVSLPALFIAGTDDKDVNIWVTCCSTLVGYDLTTADG